VDQKREILLPFSTAYVFFEKIRVMERKEKTKKRLKNEAKYRGGDINIKYSKRGKGYYF
jgi:hypothetical protein